MKSFHETMTMNEKLDAMKTWPDGWNSYGAHAPRHTAIERARQWLADIQIAIPPEQWLEPSIGGEGDGGICIEVWHGKRKLSLGIDEHEIAGIQVWGSAVTSPMTDIDIVTTEDAVQAWAWLHEVQQ